MSSWYNKGQWTVPSVDMTAARGKDGKVHVALVNVDPNRAVTITTALPGVTATKAAGSILRSNRINDHNRFDAPNTVAPQPFTGAVVEADNLSVTLPPASIAVVTLE